MPMRGHRQGTRRGDGPAGPPPASAQTTRVAVLLVDTDRVEGDIDLGVYGHFLEHINHSVGDGLFAEQVRGQGFEGNDFQDYWQPFSEDSNAGSVQAVTVPSANGDRSVRIELNAGSASIRQDRVHL